MKLKKLFKIIDPISDIVIWTNEDDEESGPSYEGSILDVPWWLTETKLGREDGDIPCYISQATIKGRKDAPCIIVNVIV